MVSRLGVEPRTLALKWQAKNMQLQLLLQLVRGLLHQNRESPTNAKNSQEIARNLFHLAAGSHT
jgi:hypothetical protein